MPPVVAVGLVVRRRIIPPWPAPAEGSHWVVRPVPEAKSGSLRTAKCESGTSDDQERKNRFTHVFIPSGSDCTLAGAQPVWWSKVPAWPASDEPAQTKAPLRLCASGAIHLWDSCPARAGLICEDAASLSDPDFVSARSIV